MGHRTTRPPGRPKKTSNLPSPAFMIFAALGVIVLIWFLIALMGQPMKPPLQ